MIPAINGNNAVKEGKERKESQQPLISSPKRPAPARSHVHRRGSKIMNAVPMPYLMQTPYIYGISCQFVFKI